MPFEKLSSLDGGEPSSAIRARVEAARAVQAERFAPLGKPNVLVNGDMGPAEVQRFCQVDEEGKNLMRAAVRQMDLSARSYHRVLKLARTIADLAGEEAIQTQFLGRGVAVSAAESGVEIDYHARNITILTASSSACSRNPASATAFRICMRTIRNIRLFTASAPSLALRAVCRVANIDWSNAG